MDKFIWSCICLYVVCCVVGFLKVDSDGDIKSWGDWELFTGLGVGLSIIGYVGFLGIIIHKIIIKMKKKSENLNKK